MATTSPENYDEHALEYSRFADDSFSWQYLERPTFDKYISSSIGTDATVLDVGSGSGRVVRYLLGLGLKPENIFGIDPSERMIKAAKNTNPEVTFMAGEFQSLPFSSRAVNLITANMVLHNLDKQDATVALAEASRVLAYDGFFAFVDTNPYQDLDNLHVGEWIDKKSPWGKDLTVFQHDFEVLLGDVAVSKGLELLSLDFPLPPVEGQSTNPDEYARYSAKQFRIAGLLQKIA